MCSEKFPRRTFSVLFCAQYKVPVFVFFSSGGEGNWAGFISFLSMNQLTSETCGIFQPLQHTYTVAGLAFQGLDVQSSPLASELCVMAKDLAT